MKLLTILLILISFSVFAEEAYITQLNKSSYKFNLATDGTFKLTHKLKFKSGVTLKNIFFDGFYNSARVKSFDDSIKSIRYSDLPTKTNFNSNFSKSFSVVTSGSKGGQTSIIKMDCSGDKNGTTLKIECEVDKNAGSGDRLFYSYKNSLECTKSSQYSCTMISKGKIKKQSFLWVKRSSQRLAISANVEVLRSNTFITAYLNGKTSYTTSSVERTRFYTQNIEPFWPDLIAKLNSKDTLNNSISAESTSNGIDISN
jgi:hypothetical protein